MYCRQLQKSVHPPLTKEIKFDNLAVTGVLWLRLDHVGGRLFSEPCSVCLCSFGRERWNLGFVRSEDKNPSDVLNSKFQCLAKLTVNNAEQKYQTETRISHLERWCFIRGNLLKWMSEAFSLLIVGVFKRSNIQPFSKKHSNRNTLRA